MPNSPRWLPGRALVVAIVMGGLFQAIAAAPAPVASAAGSDAEGSVVIDVAPAVATAVRGLGSDLAFYTTRRRPLSGLSALQRPGRDVASPHLQLARGLLTLLRAGGAPIDPGAAELMTLIGTRHLATVFAGPRPVKLLIVRESLGAGAQVEKAGGIRLFFRDTASGKLLAAPSTPIEAQAPGGAGGATLVAVAPGANPGAALVSSFGPVVKVVRTNKARQRHFQPTAVTIEARSPRRGHQFVVLHITRDFSRGVGTVSFLYGSGVIVQPDYDSLQLDVGGKKVRPAAVFDEGPTLELAYELPAAAERAFLIDEDARLPLAL